MWPYSTSQRFNLTPLQACAKGSPSMRVRGRDTRRKVACIRGREGLGDGRQACMQELDTPSDSACFSKHKSQRSTNIKRHTFAVNKNHFN